MRTDLERIKYEDLKDGGLRIKKIFDDGSMLTHEKDSHDNITLSGNMTINNEYENDVLRRTTDNYGCITEYDEKGRLISMRLKNDEDSTTFKYYEDKSKNVKKVEKFVNEAKTESEKKYFFNGLNDKDNYIALFNNINESEPEDNFELKFENESNNNTREIEKSDPFTIHDREYDENNNCIRERNYVLTNERFYQYDENNNIVRDELYNECNSLVFANLDDIEYDEKDRPVSITRRHYSCNDDQDTELYQKETNSINLKQLYYQLNR